MKNLYRVTAQVRPLPEHKLYYELQFGHLFLWMHADSPEDAADRARVIIDQLPYERSVDYVRVGLEDDVSPSDPDDDPLRLQIAERANAARHVGLAIFLVAMPTGTDEEVH